MDITAIISAVAGPVLASVPPWFVMAGLLSAGIFIVYRYCIGARTSTARTMFAEMREEMTRLYDRVERYESKIDEIARERDAAREYANELLHLIRNHLQVIQGLMMHLPPDKRTFEVREIPIPPWKTTRQSDTRD